MIEEKIKTYNISNFQQAEITVIDNKTRKKITLDEYRKKLLEEENHT